MKGAGPAANTLASAQAAVRALDPSLPLFGVATLESATSVSLLPVKVAAIVTGALGALALVLGAIGLYGVMAAIAQQRTREIGIRMALGAQAGAVVRLVTSSGMRWTAIGIALGMAAAYGVASAAAGFLYGVSARRSGRVCDDSARAGCRGVHRLLPAGSSREPARPAARAER